MSMIGELFFRRITRHRLGIAHRDTAFEFRTGVRCGDVGAVTDVGVCVLFELLTCAIKYEHTCCKVQTIPSGREVDVAHGCAHI